MTYEKLGEFSLSRERQDNARLSHDLCPVSRNTHGVSHIFHLALILTFCTGVEAHTTLLTIEPTAEQPRNSEGDIIELKDGRLCLIYTRFTGGTSDHAAADLASYNGNPTMWRCEECDELIDDQFDACWNCCHDNGANGARNDTEESCDSSTDAVENQADRPWQFNLKSLSLLLTCTAVLAAIGRLYPSAFLFCFVAIAVANLVGVAIGLFVTHVLGFPTDGSLRGESSSPVSATDENR